MEGITSGHQGDETFVAEPGERYPAVATAYFTVAPEKFNSPNLAEMRRKLGEVGIFAGRTPIEGWPDMEFQMGNVVFRGEQAIMRKVQDLVDKRR